LLVLLLNTLSASAQVHPEVNPYYARRNSFGIFGAYSPDSSHILLGYSENRKLVDFGVSYNRRLLLGSFVNWQYSLELLPVALESDPVGVETNNQVTPTVMKTTYDFGAQFVTCAPATIPYSYAGENGVVYSGTLTYACSGRRWTIGEAISPIGMQWNFMPRRKIQPFFTGHGGYMYSTQPIPIIQAGSFNFTFDLGAGFEVYRSLHKSIRVEYRYHHISNHNTAQENPGIDSGLFQASYVFGR
jgi:opacity protein-like surface antigen